MSLTEHQGALVMSSSSDPPLAFRAGSRESVWSNRLLGISGAEEKEEQRWLALSVLNIIVFTLMNILLLFPVDYQDWGNWLDAINEL